MDTTSSDGIEASPVGDRGRRRPIVETRIAELTVPIASPAEYRPIGCYGTGVRCACADDVEVLLGGDPDGHRGIRERAVAELAEAAEPPAVNLSLGAQGARVLVPGTDGHKMCGESYALGQAYAKRASSVIRLDSLERRASR
jgi:hypothetical protein